MKELIVLGYDPGVTRFGCVAVEKSGGEPVRYATFTSTQTKAEPYHRVTQLSNQVAAWANDVVKGYRRVVLVAESPIVGKNAKNFMLQMRLFQQVLSTSVHTFSPDMVLEVNPTTVKRVGAGNGKATKVDMVEASWIDYGNGVSDDDVEALADAQAIAQCYFAPSVLDGDYFPNDKTPACKQGPCVSGGV